MNRFSLKYHLITAFIIGILSIGNTQMINGYVLDENTKSPIADAEIVVNADIVATTNDAGEFECKLGRKKTHIIVLHPDYKILDTLVLTNLAQEPLILSLSSLSYNLSEIEIKARRKEVFALRELRDVEGTTINAGKKTEVIILEKLTANLAANQSRQIYSQVAGLNIYEGSDGGLQLAVGGRGLDPNRTANFNTRQNGYDISADVLGYPESYYTPPAQAIKEIQIIRGASSLQYGTQFGGLINFKLNELETVNSWAAKSAITYGSYNLLDTYHQITAKKTRWKFNSYYNFKRGDGYRQNSDFNSHNVFALCEYIINQRSTISAEYTYFNYLAKQAGGLTDQQFADNPRQSTRERNWFAVNWNLFNIKYKYQFNEHSKISASFFGLYATRKALGFRGNAYDLNSNPILAMDEQDSEGNYLHPRDLIAGTFRNYGLEAKWINDYNVGGKKGISLLGLKWYDANNSSKQGPGSSKTDADFGFYFDENKDYPLQSDYTFPNHNLALFAENIFYLNNRLSLVPGVRFEYINTKAKGTYNQIIFDNAGNPIANRTFDESRSFDRKFILFGLGMNYKQSRLVNLYANLSQNYRSVTFSDIRIVNPTFIIDPNISDERGYTFDVGIKGRRNKLLSYNLGTFGVLYQDRIGIIFDDRANRVRKNIGDAFIWGVELFADADLVQLQAKSHRECQIKPFVNVAYTYSTNVNSESQNVVGKQVEFVPKWNLKTGITLDYKDFRTSVQYSFLSLQYTDAQNSPIAQKGDLRSGIIGEIPAYGILDVGMRYTFRKFAFSAGINNVLNRAYFTRRATGYPGPGIIPSEGINGYVGVSLQWNKK